MTTKEIADKLVAYCREGKYEECYRELYSKSTVSIEPLGSRFDRADGLEAMASKGKAWQENILEFHGASVGDPIVASQVISSVAR